MSIFKTIAKISAAAVIAASLMGCSQAETPPDTKTADKVVGVTQDNSGVSENSGAVDTHAADIAAIADMTPVQLMDSAAAHSNALADVMAKVNDEASAEAAVAQMRALGPKMSAAMTRLDNLDQSDMSFSIKTMKSVQALAEGQMRIFNETTRITKEHPELRDTIIAGFEDLEIKIQ